MGNGDNLVWLRAKHNDKFAYFAGLDIELMREDIMDFAAYEFSSIVQVDYDEINVLQASALGFRKRLPAYVKYAIDAYSTRENLQPSFFITEVDGKKLQEILGFKL